MRIEYAEDAAVTDARSASDAAPRRPAGLSRRGLLAAGSAAVPMLLAACQGVRALGAPPPPPRDIRMLRAAIAAEELLVATYATAITQLTRLPASQAAGAASPLAAARAVYAEHAAHLAQLRSRLIEPAGPARSPAPAPSGPAVAEQAGSIASLLAALERAEQAASDRLLGQLAGLPPTLAQLYASIAASEATHVPYLQQAQAG